MKMTDTLLADSPAAGKLDPRLLKIAGIFVLGSVLALLDTTIVSKGVYIASLSLFASP